MRKTLLLVDDSILMRSLVKAFLSSYAAYDVEVQYAADGLEAFAKLQGNPDTDVILLDINMPGMSGLEFLEQFKREAAFQGIPVVLVSTEDHAEDIARGLEAGATAYLPKPFTPQQLHALMDRIFAAPSGGVSGSR
ncbi:MAG: response regulator [Gemmatimonadetes bacterium]|nr:response regulator [Gemmatimonadota bacterium]